jgi:hypothetical protein
MYDFRGRGSHRSTLLVLTESFSATHRNRTLDYEHPNRKPILFILSGKLRYRNLVDNNGELLPIPYQMLPITAEEGYHRAAPLRTGFASESPITLHHRFSPAKAIAHAENPDR